MLDRGSDATPLERSQGGARCRGRGSRAATEPPSAAPSESRRASSGVPGPPAAAISARGRLAHHSRQAPDRHSHLLLVGLRPARRSASASRKAPSASARSSPPPGSESSAARRPRAAPASRPASSSRRASATSPSAVAADSRPPRTAAIRSWRPHVVDLAAAGRPARARGARWRPPAAVGDLLAGAVAEADRRPRGRDRRRRRRDPRAAVRWACEARGSGRGGLDAPARPESSRSAATRSSQPLRRWLVGERARPDHRDAGQRQRRWGRRPASTGADAAASQPASAHRGAPERTQTRGRRARPRARPRGGSGSGRRRGRACRAGRAGRRGGAVPGRRA